MRPTYGVPQDNGSCQSHQCPPSHHKMVLTPEYAQASARAPRPSQPSTGSPMSLAPVSPYHQQGSTMPLAAPAAYSSCHLVPFASMGGGSPHTWPHDRSYGSMAPSPATTEVTPPLPSLAHPSSPARSYPSHPHQTMGGDSRRVDGALACYHRGGNAIAELGPSFLAGLVFSHPPSTKDGGERHLGGRPCFALQSPAFGICHVYRPRIC
jgi:hypothetical protein